MKDVKYASSATIISYSIHISPFFTLSIFLKVWSYEIKLCFFERILIVSFLIILKINNPNNFLILISYNNRRVNEQRDEFLPRLLPTSLISNSLKESLKKIISHTVKSKITQIKDTEKWEGLTRVVKVPNEPQLRLAYTYIHTNITYTYFTFYYTYTTILHFTNRDAWSSH